MLSLQVCSTCDVNSQDAVKFCNATGSCVCNNPNANYGTGCESPLQKLQFTSSMASNSTLQNASIPLLSIGIKNGTPADYGIWFTATLSATDRWSKSVTSATAVYNDDQSACKCNGYSPSSGDMKGLGSRCAVWNFTEPWCYVDNSGACSADAELSWYYPGIYYRTCDLAVNSSFAWQVESSDFYPAFCSEANRNDAKSVCFGLDDEYDLPTGDFTLTLTGNDIIDRQQSTAFTFTVVGTPTPTSPPTQWSPTYAPTKTATSSVVVGMSLSGACNISTTSLTSVLQEVVLSFCGLSDSHPSSDVGVAISKSECPSRRSSGDVSSTLTVSNLDDDTASSVSSLFSEIKDGNATTSTTFLSLLRSVGGDDFYYITGITVTSVSVSSNSSSSSLATWAIVLIVVACVLCFLAIVALVVWNMNRHNVPHNRNYVPRANPPAIPDAVIKDGSITYTTKDGLSYSIAPDTASPTADVEAKNDESPESPPTMGDSTANSGWHTMTNEETAQPTKQPEPVDHLVQI